MTGCQKGCACFQLMAVLPTVVLLCMILWVSRCDTQYAPAFSWVAFASVHAGDDAAALLERLGEPCEKYDADGIKEWEYHGVRYIVDAFGDGTNYAAMDVLAAQQSETLQIVSLSGDRLLRRHGEPWIVRPRMGCEYWKYSYSPGNTNYWVTAFLVDRETGRVLRKYNHFYLD